MMHNTTKEGNPNQSHNVSSYLLEWLSLKKQEMTSVGKSLKETEALHTAGRHVNWCSHYGKVWRFLKKLKIELSHDLMVQTAMQETWVWFMGWEDPLEKGMATHSSILAWRIPWTEEPGRLQSMGLQRVRHNWVTNTFYFHIHIYGFPRWLSGKESACKCKSHRRHRFDPTVWTIFWRRAWQWTPVFLPGKSHGQRSLSGYSPWGRKESDTTERLTLSHDPAILLLGE